MPLTKKQIDKLINYGITREFKRINPTKDWLHGFIYGLDYAQQTNSPIGQEHDYTTYNVFITTDKKLEKLKGESDLHYMARKRQLAEKENRILESHDPKEIENFITYWLDKDFKFD